MAMIAEGDQNAIGWAVKDGASPTFSPFTFTRRANGAFDVTVRILYCGICHTDLHFAKNDHGMSIYPLIPGHEIIGEIIEVGREIKNFKVGDKAGVGCLQQTCRACNNCKAGQENYCPKPVYTYSSIDYNGSVTYGGYSNKIVIDEYYVIKIPDSLPLDSSAPLLCAGITVYSPMQYFGLNRPGLSIGVVGLGGLGHIAVKFAKAYGMEVTVISTSTSKEREAIELLGAERFLISHDEVKMKAATGRMDGIIDTVSAAHSVAPLINLLKTNGKLVIVGAAPEPLSVPSLPLLIGRKLVGGSIIGGIKETQEMINFAAEHKINAEIEVIPMNYVNTAMERLAKGDVRYRFVIDIANTLIP